MSPRLPLITFLLAFVPAVASADGAARLDFAMVEGGEIAQDGRFAVVVGDDAVAVTNAVDAGQDAVLFRRKGDEVVFVDHARGEYTVITEAWLDEAATRAREAARAAQARLEALGESEAAAALLRTMPLVDASGPSQSRAAARYRPRGRDSAYNGMSCSQFDEIVAGEPRRIVCLADADAIGLSTGRAALLERFLATLARLQRAGLAELGFVPPPLARAGETFEGIPIVATDANSDGYLLAGPASGDASAAALQVPARYLEAKIPLYGF